jgi:multidrug resistance efflux pump
MISPGRCFAALLMLATPAAATEAKTYALGVAVSGLVAQILVADGAHVESGAPLVKIDCRPLEQEIRMRAADLAAAQANYQRVKNGPRPDEIAIGEANVGVAQARGEEAADAYARLRALTEGVSVTRAQLLEGRREARVTAAQLNDAQKRLALLRAGSRQEDVDEALAKRDAAAAELAVQQARVDQCTVVAPAAGTVEILATPGQYVSEYVPTTLARLTPDRK